MPTNNQLALTGRKIRRYKNKRRALQNCPQKKGTCIKTFKMTPRKPNSAMRKVISVKFKDWKWQPFVFIPGDRGQGGKKGGKGKDGKEKHPVQKFAHVLVRGGRAKDLPGVKYSAVCGKLDVKRLESRINGRSKFGVKLNRERPGEHIYDKKYKKFHYN